MWRYAAARVTGSSHVRAGAPCQDRLACTVLSDGSLVAAMSDGAGSASRAELGAEVAVRTVLTELRRDVAGGHRDPAAALRRAALEARSAVLSRARRRDEDPGSYASTLLALIDTPHGGAALQIGDGVIVVGRGADEWDWVFWPQHGEYANTTCFLTDEDAGDRIEIVAFSDGVSDAAVMTDGLQMLALDYADLTAHAPFFRGMFQPLVASEGSAEIDDLSASLEDFLSSERVQSRTDDDLSLILATRRPPPTLG